MIQLIVSIMNHRQMSKCCAIINTTVAVLPADKKLDQKVNHAYLSLPRRTVNGVIHSVQDNEKLREERKKSNANIITVTNIQS